MTQNLKTRISVQGEVTIVELSGYLDFENANPLAESIGAIYKAEPLARVVINLRGLEFVGSSGISSFVKTLRSYNTCKVKPSYVNVKSEFQRLFRLFEEEEPFEIFDDEAMARNEAIARYHRWQSRTPRSNATH